MPAAAGASTLTFPALGTFATVLVTDPAALGEAHRLLAAELAAIDAACSRFRDDSELSRVNHARGRPVEVSPLFADALTVALDAAELTDGDVDPTCGQSLARLGYDRDFALARQCTDPLRQPPMPAGGWRRVELDRGHPAVRVPAGILLDLGATAKALAADRAAAAVQAAVGGGVLINLGGDLRVAGDPPDGGWPVGIADDAGFDTSPARSSWSATAAWPRRVRSAAPGDAAMRGCIISSTRSPAGPPGPAGAPSASPPRAASARTSPAPRRSCAASARSRGWTGSACPPASSGGTAPS